MTASSAHNHRKEKSGFSRFQVIVLVLCALSLQRLYQPNLELYMPENPNPTTVRASSYHESQSYHNPLAIPEGRAQNLPSIRVEDEKLEASRQIYGGKGDKKHLGGFTDIDMHGISPATWKHVVNKWTVQSVLDVGCGKGTSTSWFVTHGLRTECVEGSHDAIEKSMVPDKSIVTEHDFSRGPWWPEKTFDMVWSVEFLEHVNLQYQYNYISSFRKAAIIMVTSSFWGGWHHVEVHEEEWWIRKFEGYGFRFDPRLTDEIRQLASEEKRSETIFPPNGETLNAQHIYTSMKVFINPVVAALPEHAHLFGEFGCYQDTEDPRRECGKATTPEQVELAEGETPLDPSFYPLQLNPEQDQVWYDIVESNIHQQPEE